ncbi:glycoside hydrolase family 3 protein [Zasmidium cellare ATCC 36951]|uniref:Probable beta-glucosidase E n=1 Tax=Zasmidium cellare ATCC 36951 TaxID=1080233 RepID=A0A6A6BZF0_ZASCE|nr:glycoside hydrolase family 3 protein [Zasmidium cellare ATCC 36951]KAF2160095.1 glycoside hydrolase family 3 protein [Zasmidium cellare ATCC 36951]
MPLKPPESYELDQPFLERKSLDEDDDGDLSDVDEFDPLKNSKRPYTDDAEQPLKSVFDSDKSEGGLAWSDSRRRRGGWQQWLVPSKFCCALMLLFVATLVLLLSAGGIWVYKSAGVPEDGESDAWYPSPKGGVTERWKDSYSKAKEMVGKMTLVEKVNVTSGTGWMMGPCVGNTGPVDRLGFPSLCLQDGPLGLRFVDNASAFPAGVTVGATWNKDLMYQRGKAHGFEAKLKGINVILGPSMGPLGRLPAGGRNWEGFGADPVLQGIASAETIRGIQESGVMATAKHLVGNEQEHFRQSWEWGLPNAISSNIDDRSLHELYVWPFADSVRAGVASVMCSYNQVNNSYACQNSKLMNGILKDEMGFQGFIQSDWLAQRSGVASALAGLDMTMPGDGLKWQDGKTLWGGELTKAVLNGSVPVDRLNDAVLRIVAAWYQLGQDDTEVWPKRIESSSATFSSWTDEEEGKLHPGSPGDEETAVVNQFVPVRQTDEGGDHDELGRKIATEGIVLVKNDDNVLPIKPDGSNIHSTRYGKSFGESIKIGIFGEDAFSNPRGPNACEDRACNEYTLGVGWGSGASQFPYLISPFDALNATFNHSSVKVTTHDRQAPKHAGGIAENQDLCIVFATSDAGEGYKSWGPVKGDRPNLLTQKHGDTLITEVAKKCGNAYQSTTAAANTIVVLHTVGPVVLEQWIDLPGVKAVLIAHLPGQESGNALADVMFGKVSPSGHLPYTIAKDEDDYGPDSKILTMPKNLVPQQNFTEGLYIDYRYFDKHNITPRYEFGYGLSYTEFHLSSVVVETHPARGDIPATRPSLLSPPSLDDSIPAASSAVWPDGFKPLKKFIYPYIDSASEGSPNGKPELPYDPEKPHSLSPAGGGEGGNPDLYTSVATVRATLTNLGKVAGSSVVQLYISYPPKVKDSTGAIVDTPVKVLRGFEKVAVGIENESKRQPVQFNLTRRDLSYWDVKRQNWVMPRGDFTVHLGFSSRDLPEKVTLNPFGI